MVETVASAREAADEAADANAAALREAVQERGAATFIATGGRTPAPVYDRLARADLAWDKVTVTLTDERWVDAHSADSNERLLLDVFRGDSTLFVRRDEVEEAWRWVDGVEAAWAEAGMAPKPYPAGSWGPAGAFALIERTGRAWNG